MSRISTWAAVFCMAVVAQAIVCPRDYCSTVTCKEVKEEDCNGIVNPRGTFCGCCPACVAIIPEGQSCLLLGANGLSAPPTEQCIEGTECINFTCQAVPANSDS